MMTKVVVVFENYLFQEKWIGTMFLGGQLLSMITMVAKKNDDGNGNHDTNV